MCIYPNPGKGVFTVNMGSAEKRLLRIVDMEGRLLFIRYLTESFEVIDTGFLTPGIYTVILSGNEPVENRKLVVIR
jgi:hypothetical protein